jgi:hypothetical protein
MSDEGFGEPANVRASDVLIRLKAVAGGAQGAALQGATLIESSTHFQ